MLITQLNSLQKKKYLIKNSRKYNFFKYYLFT